jgi:hypothetical protein
MMCVRCALIDIDDDFILKAPFSFPFFSANHSFQFFRGRKAERKLILHREREQRISGLLKPFFFFFFFSSFARNLSSGSGEIVSILHFHNL